MPNLQLSRRARAAILATAAVMVGLVTYLQTTAVAQSPTHVQLTPTPTPTFCPVATPEQLQVEPVTSPTDLFTQTITVRIGNGDAITITAESGTFVVAGTHPRDVPIALAMNITHHLNVAAHVRLINSGGCIYGNYTLHTSVDRYGASLTIVQKFDGILTPRAYLPVILASVDSVYRLSSPP